MKTSNYNTGSKTSKLKKDLALNHSMSLSSFDTVIYFEIN